MARTPIPPRAPAVRFPVDPGDVPPEKIARRLHLTMEQFRQVLPRLLQRGFPAQDPDTGMFDLEAVDRWRHGRHSRLFPDLPNPHLPEDAPPPTSIFRQRVVEAELKRKAGDIRRGRSGRRKDSDHR